MAVGKDKWNAVLKGGASIIDVRPVFSFDSKFLMCVSAKVIKVLSLFSGEYLCELRGHEGRITCIELNPANKFQLLSASVDKTLISWDYQDGVALKTYKLEYSLLALCSTMQPDNSMVGVVCNGTKDTTDKKNRYSLATVQLPSGGKDVKLEKVVNGVGKRQVEVAINTQDGYVACIRSDVLKVFVLSTQKIVHKRLQYPAEFPDKMTCVACHPTEQCIATGCESGKIVLWWNFLAEKAHLSQTVRHWHSWPVADLTFTPEGSCLLSGGNESVLIKWIHDMSDRKTLPRLTAPFAFLSCSPDGTRYATCHKDNVILVISSNMEVVQIYQGLTHCSRLFVRLTFDPRTLSLVCPGRPGHLQFYCVDTDRELYSLDIVGQNYFTSTKGGALLFTVIDCMAFSATGQWLATVERRDDAQTAMEMRLKFWHFNDFNQQYSLNTLVDLPHTKTVTSISFRPLGTTNKQSAVTTSEDGQFKIWQLADDSDIYRQNEAWTCESVGYYRHQVASCAQFSTDGSMLAVGFGPTVTLWDPDTNELRLTLSPLGGDTTSIISVCFGVDRLQHLLSAATKSRLTVYNLLVSNVLWSIALDINLVASNQLDNTIAVFTQDGRVLVYRLDSDKFVAKLREISKPAVKGAVFVPYNHETCTDGLSSSSSSWQRSARLCYMTTKQELWTVEDEAENEKIDELPSSHPALMGSSEHTAPMTPFALLMKNKLKQKTDQNSALSSDQLEHNVDSHFVSEMLATPAHVLPPLGTLCSGFLDKLLISRKKEKAEEDDSDDEEDKEEEEDILSSSDAEMETEKVVAVKKSNASERIQDVCDDIVLEEFTWTNDIKNL